MKKDINLSVAIDVTDENGKVIESYKVVNSFNNKGLGNMDTASFLDILISNSRKFVDQQTIMSDDSKIRSVYGNNASGLSREDIVLKEYDTPENTSMFANCLHYTEELKTMPVANRIITGFQNAGGCFQDARKYKTKPPISNETAEYYVAKYEKVSGTRLSEPIYIVFKISDFNVFCPSSFVSSNIGTDIVSEYICTAQQPFNSNPEFEKIKESNKVDNTDYYLFTTVGTNRYNVEELNSIFWIK